MLCRRSSARCASGSCRCCSTPGCSTDERDVLRRRRRRPTLVVDDARAGRRCSTATAGRARAVRRWPDRCTTRRAPPGDPKGVWSGVLDEADGDGAPRRGGRAVGLRRRRRAPRLLAAPPLGAIRFARAARCSPAATSWCCGTFDAARAASRRSPHAPTDDGVHGARPPAAPVRARPQLPDLSSFRLLAHAGAPCPDR